MKDLHRKAFRELLQLILILAAAIFLPAWTFRYWQAWVFLSVFTVSVLLITLYLMKKDPKLLERRVKGGPLGEKERTQRLIQFLASIAFLSMIILPSLDHRLAWSIVPSLVVISGDILVVSGLLFVFFVFKENSYTSGVIEVSEEQKVISSGPYALIRHPMYLGAFVMLIGVPLALGSWWGLCSFIPMMIVIIWRLLDEEKFLVNNLPGYPEYRNKTRYRLVPFIW